VDLNVWAPTTVQRTTTTRRDRIHDECRLVGNTGQAGCWPARMITRTACTKDTKAPELLRAHRKCIRAHGLILAR
jgi:hypothetical protein